MCSSWAPVGRPLSGCVRLAICAEMSVYQSINQSINYHTMYAYDVRARRNKHLFAVARTSSVNWALIRTTNWAGRDIARCAGVDAVSLQIRDIIRNCWSRPRCKPLDVCLLEESGWITDPEEFPSMNNNKINYMFGWRAVRLLFNIGFQYGPCILTRRSIGFIGLVV